MDIAISGITCDVQEFSYTPKHCGVLNFYCDSIEFRDFLQLFYHRVPYRKIYQMVIFPKALYMENAELGDVLGESSEEKEVASKKLQDTELIEIREYQTGDAKNQIHWKMSARCNELMVKVHDSLDESKWSLIVDLSIHGNDSKLYLDRIYQTAYSLGLCILEMNHGAQIVVWNAALQRCEMLVFTTKEELSLAMISLMQMKCTENSLEQLERAFAINQFHIWEDTVLITANANLEKSRREYRVLCVKESYPDKILNMQIF